MPAQGDTVIQVLASVSAANTAAATSAWLATPLQSVGDLQFQLNIGVITGTITPTIEDATDDQGAGGAGVTPTEGAFTAITASGSSNNDPAVQVRSVPIRSLRAYYRFVGTIITGPSVVGVTATYKPKDTANTTRTVAAGT